MANVARQQRWARPYVTILALVPINHSNICYWFGKCHANEFAKMQFGIYIDLYFIYKKRIRIAIYQHSLRSSAEQ